jgi:hypothetical protein
LRRIAPPVLTLLYCGILAALALWSARSLHGTVCQDVYFGFHQVQARSSIGLSLPVPVVQMCDNGVLPLLLIALTIAACGAWSAVLRFLPNAWILAAGACAAAASSIVFPYVPSTDPYAYALYGYEALHGTTPYASSAARTPNSSVLRTLDGFFPPKSSNRIANYGPVAVLQYQTVAFAAGDSLERFVLLQRAFNASLILLLGWLLMLVRAPGSSRREAAWIAFHPLLLIESVAFGHGDVLMLALLCAALAAYRRGAIFLCAALVVLACEVRLVAALALAVLLVELSRRNPRVLMQAICSSIVTLGITAVAAIAAYGKFTFGGAPAIEAFSSPLIFAFDAFGVTMKHVGQGLLTQAALGLALIAVALLLKRYLYLPFAALAALPIVRAWYCQWLVPAIALTANRNIRIAAGVSAGVAIVAEYPAMTAHSDLRTWFVILLLQWLAPIAALLWPWGRTSIPAHPKPSSSNPIHVGSFAIHQAGPVPDRADAM